MNKRDLKRMKIDSSYIISPEKFLLMFGIECNKMKKIDIHDLHYILGNYLKHVGVNKVNVNSVYNGEIILIGTENKFKPYYRPIVYKIKVDDKINEVVESTIKNNSEHSLEELCCLYNNADNMEDLERYIDEIYLRTSIDPEQTGPRKTKTYAFANKAKQHWAAERIRKY